MQATVTVYHKELAAADGALKANCELKCVACNTRNPRTSPGEEARGDLARQHSQVLKGLWRHRRK